MIQQKMERSGQSKQLIEEIKRQDFVMDRSWSLRERDVNVGETGSVLRS